jgi:hypothetical protein
MEIWIVGAVALGLAVYLTGRRRRSRQLAPRDPKNIYPLW